MLKIRCFLGTFDPLTERLQMPSWIGLSQCLVPYWCLRPSYDVLGTFCDVLGTSCDVLGTSCDVLGTSCDVNTVCSEFCSLFIVGNISG